MRGLRVRAVGGGALWRRGCCAGGCGDGRRGLAGTGDYTTIQPALAAAAEGDRYSCYRGRGQGRGQPCLRCGTKNIVLIRRDGAAASSTAGAGSRESWHQLLGGGQDSTCVVDGFTIKEREARSSPGTNRRRDPCEGRTPPQAGEPDCPGQHQREGIRRRPVLQQHASPIVRNVVFDGNHAQAGGGLYCNYELHPKLRDVTFIENHAVTHGGGAYCGMDCDAWFSTSCSMSNTSGHKGGGFACWHSSPRRQRGSRGERRG